MIYHTQNSTYKRFIEQTKFAGKTGKALDKAKKSQVVSISGDNGGNGRGSHTTGSMSAR
jgi:hypothetical protein